ncbi:MAG: ornithine cyclodeaminase [Nocardioidaceae bacterium]|nr:ornithine cyclodeaminase [Nocardioidaceae bacterium]
MSAVPFLSVANTARWVRERGLTTVLADLTEAIEADFRRWPDFDKTPRVAAHSTDGVIELMPVADATSYGFKYVNGHPLNPTRGFQTVTAFGVLADVLNGYPTFLSEMTVLTALRTAATSAMAARALCRPNPTTMALIGTGSQAEFQAAAFQQVLGVDRVRAWDVDPAAVRKFLRNAAELGIDAVAAESAEDAVRGADIITTCTADKAYATVLTDDMVSAGVHVNAIGGDCPGKTELDRAILERASVFVEYEPQTRIEGELQQLPADFRPTELWQVLTGVVPGRTSAEEITVFDSVGFAVEDFSTLRYVFEAVRGTELVEYLDVVADPADPKDLFALVSAARVPA